MGWARHLVLPMLLLLASACSMKTAVEKFSSPEDRAFAMRFVANVRSGNEAALEREFDPAVWAASRQQLPGARSLFPRGQGGTTLVGYRVATNLTNGASSTTKDYVLVTTDRTHWTRTRIVTLAQGGRARVMGWKVDGFGAPPPELQMYETMNRLAPWFQAVALLVLVGGIALVWWLVRRSRRRAATGP